ncbi:MAG: substrate-binding domain-containing protein [Planctomycetota bacterium]|nr:substrate-binding domain-containing protein [Planctomycetota bacterium]
MTRWTRFVSTLACLAGLALLGAGCRQESKSTSRPRKFTVGLIAKSTSNPVFQAALNGARARAAELKAKTGMDIVIDWQTPAKEDAQEQANRIKQLVNKGADVIIISCSDASMVTDAINDAVKSGVPVMCFDSDAAASKRFAYFGVDDVETGQATMNALAHVMGEKGVVAILAGNQNAPNLQKRVQGAKEAAKAYPGITIKDVYFHTETPEAAANMVMDVMNANHDITGWAMIGGWPLFTNALLTNWDPNVKIVAVDALPAELAYVDKGVAQVLLAQKVFDWGYESVQIAYDKVVLKKDVPVVNISKLVPVTKANLGDWARQLKAWGFEVSPEYLAMKAAAPAPAAPASVPAAPASAPADK